MGSMAINGISDNTLQGLFGINLDASSQEQQERRDRQSTSQNSELAIKRQDSITLSPEARQRIQELQQRNTNTGSIHHSQQSSVDTQNIHHNTHTSAGISEVIPLYNEASQSNVRNIDAVSINNSDNIHLRSIFTTQSEYSDSTSSSQAMRANNVYKTQNAMNSIASTAWTGISIYV